MSWHTNGVFIKSDLNKDATSILSFLGLDCEPDEVMSFDDAVSIEGLAIASYDSWTLIFGDMMTICEIDSEAIAAANPSLEIVEMTLEGSSGTAGFMVYRDGELKREYLVQANEEIKSDGIPFSFEKEAFAKNDSEDAILDIIGHLGVPLVKAETLTFKGCRLD